MTRSPLHPALVSVHASPLALAGGDKDGGLNIYLEEICREMSRRGVVTDVFTRCEGERVRVERLAERSLVHEISCGPAGARPADLLPHLDSFVDDTATMASEAGINVLWTHYWISGLAGLRLRERLDLPWVHTFHTIGAVKNRHLAPGDVPESDLRLQAERDIAAHADLLLAHTQAEQRDIVELLGAPPQRVVVIPAGVDLSLFSQLPRQQARLRLEIPPAARVMLFVGRLERLKGVETMLEAMAHLDSSVRAIIIGEDGEGGRGEAQRLAVVSERLGLGDGVEFRGRVSHRELPWYYSASDVFVIPSHTESFGLVALEAQACGCPVIATKVGGLMTVVDDGVTGLNVEGRDPAVWASAVRCLLDDPVRLEEMGRRGRDHATRFTWRRAVDALLPVLGGLPADGRLRVAR